MKTTRNTAIMMFDVLAQMALGQMDEVTLEKTMTNFEALRKVREDFEAVKNELFKRLYGDVEKMTEDEKKTLQDFFGMLAKIKDEDGEKAVRAAYPELAEKREKELKILASLSNKEIEVEIEKVNDVLFTAGLIKGNKKMSVAEIALIFHPLFEEKEKKEADFSELDELMK